MYDIQKKDPAGKILVLFLQDALKTTFWMRNQPMDTHKRGTFFQNQGTFFCKIRALFFYFQKRAGENSPTPPTSCAPIYHSKIFLNCLDDYCLCSHFQSCRLEIYENVIEYLLFSSQGASNQILLLNEIKLHVLLITVLQ